MRYQLLIYLDNDLPPITYDLNLSIYVLGKHSSCDILVIDRFVSRQHCTFVLMPPNRGKKTPYYLVIDGLLMIPESKSTNGVWINGTRVSQADLKHQDTITFGPRQYPKAIFLNEITDIKEDGTFSTNIQE